MIHSFTFIYSSTGARSYYKDYSGEYKVDYMVDSKSVGLLLENNFIINKVQIPYGSKFLYIMSNLGIESNLSINDPYESESMSLKAKTTSIGIEPYTGLQLLFDKVVIRFNISFLLSTGNYLHDPNNPNSYLLNTESKKVKVNWSGFKCGLSLGYVFPYKY